MKLNRWSSQHLKTLSLAMAALVLVSACQPDQSGHDDKVAATQDGKPNDDTWTDAEVDSENLSDEAESMLAIATLDHALEKFNQALKLNPKNGRADIWASFITLELEMRGVLARVRPFMESMPDGDRRYDRLIDNLNS